MKLNWNSTGEVGFKPKTFCGGGMDIFWNDTWVKRGTESKVSCPRIKFSAAARA